MLTAEEILNAAKKLPREKQRWLAEKLRRGTTGARKPVSEEEQIAALERWAADGGSDHSDYTDVSADKYKHLGKAYACSRE